MKIANQENKSPETDHDNFYEFISRWVVDLSQFLISAHLDPFLELNENSDLKLSALLHAYDTNPNYKQGFMNWVVSKRGKNAENETFDSCIRMMGLKPASHFLIVCMLGDYFKVKALQRDAKTQLITLPLDQILSYAHKTRETFAEGTRYHDLAFILGLFFDYIHLYSDQFSPLHSRKKLSNFIKDRFMNSLEVSRIALNLLKDRPEMSLEKDVLPLVFLEHSAQSIFAIYKPNYIEFISKTSKLHLNSGLTHYAELLLFNAHHSHLGCASIPALPVFEKLATAISNLHTPYQIDFDTHHDIYELTAIVHLSIHLNENKNSLKNLPNNPTAHDLCSEIEKLHHLVKTDELFKKAS